MPRLLTHNPLPCRHIHRCLHLDRLSANEWAHELGVVEEDDTASLRLAVQFRRVQGGLNCIIAAAATTAALTSSCNYRCWCRYPVLPCSLYINVSASRGLTVCYVVRTNVLF
jgi:hypothetical protein